MHFKWKGGGGGGLTIILSYAVAATAAGLIIIIVVSVQTLTTPTKTTTPTTTTAMNELLSNVEPTNIAAAATVAAVAEAEVATSTLQSRKYLTVHHLLLIGWTILFGMFFVNFHFVNRKQMLLMALFELRHLVVSEATALPTVL